MLMRKMSYQQTNDVTSTIPNVFLSFLPLDKRIYIGWLLLWLYLALQTTGYNSSFIVEIQGNELYKQATGFMLFMYILLQFLLASARISKKTVSTSKDLNLHIWLGAFAPLAFYLHSAKLGYGYQYILGLILLSVVMSGLLSPKLIKLRNKQYTIVWLTVHVSLAVTLPILLAYHLYVIYFYS